MVYGTVSWTGSRRIALRAAGHDLTVANLPALVKRIPQLAEVSIGHGLTADALEYGMAETVRRFCRACGQAIS